MKTKRELILKYCPMGYLVGLSEDFLWSLIPNNVKRRNGYPSSRKIKGTKKISPIKKFWAQRRRVFMMLEAMADERLQKDFEEGYFNHFVDIKDFAIGDKKPYFPVKKNPYVVNVSPSVEAIYDSWRKSNEKESHV
jgi:hypothetical protein